MCYNRAVKSQKKTKGVVMAGEFEALKLFYDRDYEKYSANALARTRGNNLIACSALATYLDTEGQKEAKAMQGYGLPANVENSGETEEYYKALKFFKNNYEYFSTSQAMIKLRDLFSWADNDEYRQVVVDCYIGEKNTRSLMKNIKDIDLRKIANCFAKDGNYATGKLKNKGDLQEIDKQIALLFVSWKQDIINFYNEKHPEEHEN